MQNKQRSPLLLMALTILIDFAGFGLIIPVLPFWALKLGANPVGIGLITTAYALAQFIFTPVLGALSDRYGRRPIILGSLLIEVVAFILTALAGSLPMLLLARFVGGLGASNIGSAQAVVSDITTPANRAKGMGLIGAAIGLGFVIGPASGGLLSAVDGRLPFFIAAGVALLNAILVFFLLPETHPRTAKPAPLSARQIWLSRWRHATRTPALTRLILVNLLFTIAFTAMETIFPLFSQQHFGWAARQNAYIFTYVGIIVVFMQGGLVGRLVKRWNEQVVLAGGLLLLSIGLVALAFSGQIALLLISVGLLSIGDGAVSPTISTLISFATPAEIQGETMGLAQGFAGLGRIMGPLIAGSIDAYSSPAISLVSSGILVLVAILIVYPILPTIQRPQTS